MISKQKKRGLQESCDCDETFASFVKPMGFKGLFAIAAVLNYEIEQMNIETAFL